MSEEKKLVPRLRFPEFRGAEGWIASVLARACDMQAGKFVAASNISESNQTGLFPCYGGNGLRGYTTTHTHDGTYPLIGRQGALCGNVRLVSGKFHATEHAVVATPKNAIDVGWLYHSLDLLNLNRFATGQAQPGLSVDVLENVSLAIPVLEDEQQKIADCLSSLDELIAAQARKVDALKTHKKGLMQQLFPREGEAQPRLRFPEFREAGEWEVGLLGQFAQVNPRRETRADDVNVSFVPMSAVSEDGHLVSPQIREYGSVKKGFTAFRNKDVIVAKITPCFENGKAALVTGLMDGIGFGSTEFHVVRASNACLPEFLFAQIYSDQFRRLGKSSMTGSGGQQRVPTAFVENYLVSIPSLAEQQRIADCLTSLDTLITTATQELETLKTHKKGLMQQLFPSAEAVAA